MLSTLSLCALTFMATENLKFVPPPISWYFEDVIALPIILGIALAAIQSLRTNWRNYTIRLRDLWVIVVLFSVHFELIMPSISAKHTQDPVDVICYLFGAMFFMLLMNKPNALRLQNSLNLAR